MALKLLRDDDTITVTDADLVEGGDKDTSYKLRKLTPEKVDEIRTKRTRKATYRRPEKVNEKAVDADLLDYVLVEWTGVLDGDKPAPCVLDNKLRLDRVRRSEMLRAAGMADVVTDDTDDEDEKEVGEREQSFR